MRSSTWVSSAAAAAATSVYGANTTTLESLCTVENIAAAIPVGEFAGLTYHPATVTANVVTNHSVTDADFQPNANFDFCNTTFTYSHTGKNDSFLLTFWLPAPANFANRYLSTGGGGYAINSGPTGLAMGVPFGAVTGDTDGGLGPADNLLVPGDFLVTNGTINYPEVYAFAYAAHHELAITGKAFARNLYAVDNSTKVYAYYQGCSEGGREGLSQVQRFESQFDGSIIGAPAIRLPFQQVQHLYAGVVENLAGVFPPTCAFAYITNATIKACDPLDGLTDGVISRSDLCELNYTIDSLVGDYYSCPAATETFEYGPTRPAANGTITESDIAITKQILAGLHNSAGQRGYFTYQVGSYLTDAVTTFNATSGKYYAAPSDLGGGWVTEALEEIAIENLVTLDGITLDTLVEWIRLGFQKYYDSLLTTWPDLTDYQSGGGKVLHFHGESDYSIPTASSVRYYESVREIMYPNLTMLDGTAALSEWYRLFLIPGAGHCAPEALQPNGPFPQTNLQVMIDWVEKDVVPVTLNATHLAGDSIGANAQVCAWPKRPIWHHGRMSCVFDQKGYETFIYDLDAYKMPIY